MFLTSQGDNKLQTLADGPRPADVRGHRASSAASTAHRPFTGGDVLPSTAWHDQFADVNNDGIIDLFVAKGNVEAEDGYATRDPSNLLIGQPDGTFVEGAEAAGIVELRAGAWRGARRPQPRRAARPRRRQPSGARRRCGATSAAATPTGRRRWARGWPSASHQPAPNVDAIGAWVETRVGDRTTVHEVTVGGGHASGAARLDPRRAGRRRQADVRVQWPDGEIGPWMTLAAGPFATIERGADAVATRGRRARP